MFSLVVDAVLVVDVQQFVFDPADLLGRLFSSLVVQTVFLVKLSQAHHGLLTHTPLQQEGGKEKRKRLKMKILEVNYIISCLIRKLCRIQGNFISFMNTVICYT